MADDLCMGAVTGHEPVALACAKALNAGHDLLIIAHDGQAQNESSDMLEAALQNGSIDRRQLNASYRRIAKLLKLGHHDREKPSPLEGSGLAARIAKGAVRLVRPGNMRLPLTAATADPLLVLVPDFRQVRQRFTFEGGPDGPERFLRRRLAAWGPAKIVRTAVETEELGRLPREIRLASRILFFCFEAMRFPGQKAVLKTLKRLGKGKTVACLIRNPWDIGLLPKHMTTIDAAGYRLCQLSAALNEVLI
jgi:hypothetical protein